MPTISALSTIEFPHKIPQHEVKQKARDFFAPSFPAVDRLIDIFENTDIQSRNFCLPVDYFATLPTFEAHNKEYIKLTLEYSISAIESCLQKSKIKKEDITDFVFVSSTGLATPSMDALIINKMHLNQDIHRMPVFGLGCAGGVSGLAKAFTLAKANPDAVVLFVSVELCSLTFLNSDFSKSNFVASSLFADGIAACIVEGDKRTGAEKTKAAFHSSESKLYYDSLDVMGWEFLDSGFKVIFSQDIPTIIQKNVKNDITNYLSKHGIELKDIKNFIFHPGGKKVLAAYEDSLGIADDFLKNTRDIMHENGNMSSATVMYVLERFLDKGFEDGYGLMLALGPGFSCEMLLLEMKNHE